MFIFFAPRIWKLYTSENQVVSFVGFWLNMVMATTMWALIWVFPWYYLVRFPYETALVNNTIAWWSNTIPVSLTSAVLGFFLIRAIRRGNLRRIPGTYVTMKEELAG
jgi:hypothetical protein